MEKLGCAQAASMLKKGKKKQAKDELDRQKQAEKKRRRLEKALATSAAIRSELEKKKQKKIEEQQRLDDEGAAIAEAVALRVLIGEDIEESDHFMMNNSRAHNPWVNYENIGLFMGYQSSGRPTGEYTSGAGLVCNEWDIGRSLPPRVCVRGFSSPFYEEKCQGENLSAGLLAAEAVASLQIAEDSRVINRMLSGNYMGGKVGFRKEF